MKKTPISPLLTLRACMITEADRVMGIFSTAEMIKFLLEVSHSYELGALKCFYDVGNIVKVHLLHGHAQFPECTK